MKRLPPGTLAIYLVFIAIYRVLIRELEYPVAREQWHVDTPKTIDLEVVRHVRVNMMGGSCNIMSHDLPSTRVEVSSLTGRDMKIAIDGDTLIIDHPQFGWGSLGESARTLVDPPKATVSILVPKNASVNAKATSADILVTGIDGDISITTIAGEHFMDGTSGKLHLTSAGGELSVRGHRGSVETRTATGDVTVTGPITSFDGNTISGSTVIDIAGEDVPPTKIDNASVSGPTTVRLPANTNASYQLITVAAKAQLGETIVEPLYGKQNRQEAPIPGAPITEVRLNSVAGRITVIGGLPAAPGQTSSGQAPASNEAGQTATAEESAQRENASQPGAWTVPPNPNIDLANAPRPEGNIVPPAPGVPPTQHPGTPPAGTHTAAGPVQNAHLTDESDGARPGDAAPGNEGNANGTESEEQR